jgi:TrmH family RNA methyltransferase
VATLTSRHNPIVARYRAAARGEDPLLMLLDGVHLVADAVAAKVALVDIVVAAGAESRADVAAAIDAIRRGGASFVSASATVMAALSPVRSSSPIVALARRPSDDAARIYDGSEPLVVIVSDVQDPGNLGAIVRVAEAAGAAGVVVAGAGADPFGWKALRGSMGSALRMPIVTRATLAQAIDEARRYDCRIVATAPRDGRSLFKCDLSGALVVLIGGEGPGLPEDAIESADQRITIPMQTPVESLNAAVTAALVLYEAQRQRRQA